MRYESLWSQIEDLLIHVEKPSRYINHEYNSCISGEDDGCSGKSYPFRIALLYPDTYDLGQSNQAIGILQHQINALSDSTVERVFLPWIDMIDLMRERGIPLFTQESATPVSACDLLGITLPHELAVTNVLEALDLADIPLHAKDRLPSHPFVIGGGPLTFNPEPLAVFFDAFLVGEGEEAILEIIDSLQRSKSQGQPRGETLSSLAQIEGVYVPVFYSLNDARFLQPESATIPAVVKKRIVKDFANLPIIVDPVVPFAEVAHDRLAVEIQRGCSRGCRFCQAGMTYRPVRERSVDTIVEAVIQGLAHTGYDEVSLTSLSSTDHSQIQRILQRISALLTGRGTSISIPSQRVDAFGMKMAQMIAGERKTGLTFAPEAGTQRLRDAINKNVSDDDLIEAVKNASALGWRRCKLYFMIGLPGENDEDIRGIAELANRAYAAAKESVPESQRGSMRMTVSVAVFIPKPHTPFQWCGQIAHEEIQRRIDLLRSAGLHKGIDLSWHDPSTSRIEAALARAGREAATLIEQAWRCGARFDAWSELFDARPWEQAEEISGLTLSALAQREYRTTEALPWDHIASGVSKKYLAAEYEKSRAGETSYDCSFDFCTDCGVCTDLTCAIQLGGGSRG